MNERISEQDLTFDGIKNPLKAHVAHSCAAMYNRRNRNPWYRLFTAIEEEAKTGKSMYVFDEELLRKLDNDFCSYGERKNGDGNG